MGVLLKEINVSTQRSNELAMNREQAVLDICA